MSVTVMPDSKWQPSVLQLLPFSPNAAGATNTRAPCLTSSGAPPTNSYIKEDVRGFPALAISHQDSEKLRSKNTGVPLKIISPRKQQSARAQPKHAKEHAIPRAKSDYGLNRSRKPEVVKFSINDINEQILGRNRLVGDRYPSSESSDPVGYQGEVSETKTKPLLKPVLRRRDGKWPNARIWRSSCFSPGELELQKHRNYLDIHNSRTRKSKRVKLNVKDLPRSKTPIGENDPDKLNMKQVIEFLQNNSEHSRDDNEDKYDDKIRAPIGNNCTNNLEMTRENISDHNSFRNVDMTSHGKPAISTTNQLSPTNISDTETFTETVKDSEPTASNQNQTEPSLPISRSREGEQSDLIGRPNSYHTDNGRSHVYFDKHSQSYYAGLRPKSLNALYEQMEFRLPANLRHIREKVKDNTKPFRLHRFLTLVSNTSGSVNIAPLPTKSLKHNHRLNDTDSSLQNHSYSSKSRSQMQSFSQSPRTGSRIDPMIRSDVHKRSSSEARRYFLSGEGSGKSLFSERVQRRAKSQESNYRKEPVLNSSNKNNVICLPVAPVEIESDDDYNPNPSVPGRLDRKGLTLSAQGRAIIAKEFPHITKFVKNGIRPHSVKDVTRRLDTKLEQTGTDQQRPLSMKNMKLDYTPQDDLEAGVDCKTSPQSTDWGQNISAEAVAGDVTSTEDEATSRSTREVEKEKLPSLSPTRSDIKSNRSKSSSGNGIITFPTEVNDFDNDDDNFVEKSILSMGREPNATSSATNNIVNNKMNAGMRLGAHSSPFNNTGDPVRLTLRKERKLTRELTYMGDIEHVELISSTRSHDTGSGYNGFNT